MVLSQNNKPIDRIKDILNNTEVVILTKKSSSLLKNELISKEIEEFKIKHFQQMEKEIQKVRDLHLNEIEYFKGMNYKILIILDNYW